MRFGLILALPLLTAAVVGIFARSRLPLAALLVPTGPARAAVSVSYDSTTDVLSSTP